KREFRDAYEPTSTSALPSLRVVRPAAIRAVERMAGAADQKVCPLLIAQWLMAHAHRVDAWQSSSDGLSNGASMSSSSRSPTLRISRVGPTNSNTRYPDLRQCKTAVQQSGAKSNVGTRE